MIALPSGYTELQWIGVTGSQYIDTGYSKPNTIFDMKLRVSFSVNGQRMLMGTNQISPNYIGRGADNRFIIGGHSSTMTTVVNDPYDLHYYREDLETAKLNITDKNGNSELVVGAGIGDTSTDHWLLFGVVGVTVGYLLEGKIYSWEYTDNGTLVRKLVPCRRASDSAIGMYDIVNDVFYGNAGAGEFTAGPSVGTHVTTKAYKSIVKSTLAIPTRYTELEYLQSSGTQYIDTNTTLSCSTDDIELDFQLINSTGQENVFGARGSTSSRVYAFGTSISYNWRVGWDGSMSETAISADTNKHTLEINHGEGNFLLDGAVLSTLGTSSITTPVSATLFAIHALSGSPVYYSSSKIYSYKMRRNETLKRNLVPCKRRSDNVLGMYDLCNTGKNLLDDSAIYSATVRRENHYRYPSILIHAGESYIFSIQNQTGSSQNLFVAQSTTDDFTSASTPYFTVTEATSFQVQPSEDTYVCVFYKETEPSIVSCRKAKAMCEYGEISPTAYEPYDGFYMNEGTGTFVAGPEKHSYIKSYKTVIATPYPTALTGSSTQSGTPTPTNPINVVNVQPFDLRGLSTYVDSYSPVTKKITRNVGKKVLDGTENWMNASMSGKHIYYIALSERFTGLKEGIGTHFAFSDATVTGVPNLNFFYYGNANTGFRYDAIATVNEFKAWLAAQYANGTPVTIYYPLASTAEENAPSVTYVSYKKNTRYLSDVVIPIVGNDLIVGTFVVNG